MYRFYLAYFIIAIILNQYSLQARPFGGPLQVRNNFPLYLTLGRQYLEQADPESSFSMAASHSSVFLNEQAGVRSVFLDLEISEVNLRYKYRIYKNLEVELALPFIMLGPGVMDGIIDAYHLFLGFPDAGRSLSGQGQFHYTWLYNDVPVLAVKPGRLGHGDLLMAPKFLLYRSNSGLALAFRLDIEIPTGYPELGHGNGHTDRSMRFILEKRLSNYCNTYFNLGLTETGDLEANKRLLTHNYVQGGVGLEFLVLEEHSFLAQILFANSPFIYTHIPEIDKNGVILSLGWRLIEGQDSWDISFTEDINTAAAPDFTLSLNYKLYY